jgi:putative membrane protein
MTAALLAREHQLVVAQRIRGIERATAAELVVTVRADSDAHRVVDVAIGAAAGFVAVLIYVFAPMTFYDDLAPAAVLISFVGAAVASAAVRVHKRWAIGAGRRRACVRSAARAAFFDQRIASTTGRTGVLVFASLLEREVEVLVDSGIDVSSAQQAQWVVAIQALEKAVAQDACVDFLQAIDALGAVLAEVCPPNAHDVNELGDAVA